MMAAKRQTLEVEFAKHIRAMMTRGNRAMQHGTRSPTREACGEDGVATGRVGIDKREKKKEKKGPGTRPHPSDTETGQGPLAKSATHAPSPPHS